MYYNLSKPQEAIYYMSKFAESSIGNIAGDVFFHFDVSVDDAREAILDFLNKCDTMHTRIINIDGKPMQQIFRDYEYKNIPIIKFNAYEDYCCWAKEDAKKPININNCLYRIFLIDINGKIGLYSVTHHIISDATSFAYIGKYVTRYLKGERDIKIYPYSEYLESEKKYSETKRYEKDRLFWLDKCKKFEVNYYSKKESESLSANRKNFFLNKDIGKKIKIFCEKYDISEYVFFFSLLAVEYFKVTQKEEFFIGTPILNRYTNMEENMLGVFVNTVPIGIKIKGDDIFEELCNRIMDSIMSAFRHQKYHYTELLKEVASTSIEEKLFDVLLSFWNVKTHDESDAEWFSCCSQIESLQIHIDDRKSEGRYCINYDYQTEKFTEKDIVAFHNHFCNIISEALEHHDKKISEFEMLTKEEKHTLLNTFNDTYFDYGVGKGETIYSLFEKTASENPEKVCLTTAQGELTFGELLSMAESLDCEIQKITKGKKSVIPVIAQRSPEMYAAIYGIIRGGNAYLPIADDYPQERIDYILENSCAPLSVVQGKYTSFIKNIPYVDMTQFIENYEKTDNILPSCAKAEDTAYVIYTSGSTGNPKGAMVSHKSAVNRILWMHEMYPLRENDVILQKTPYTFDVSVWELFWWGMVGGKLAASKPQEHFLPAKILGEVYKNNVTHLHFVPSVFELFLSYLESHREETEKFSSVKYVFLSGEALSAELIKRFYALYDYSKVSLHNLYGPTECAVDVTYYPCTPEDTNPVPIGKPIYNTQIHIVDKYMNLQPVGVKGELCIGGVNVGQGYLNNDALTAEKFIDNPFGEGKLYKTGDLAYWHEDGEIIFCGRIDFQIKLNGQRIELGEIESLLSKISGIDSACVIVKKINGNDVLTAFYCGEDLSSDTIKNYCEEKLPVYMVPAIICRIDEMPLNANGKLDKKALNSYEIAFAAKTEKEPPLDENEKFICDVFAEVLELDFVGRRDNFFSLGGTSISMISVLSTDAFKEISSAEFIANPTPAKLAVLLSSKSLSEYSCIKMLYEGNSAAKLLCLVPYAGGGAEAFAAFVRSFVEKTSAYSICYFDYPHSDKECMDIANEIARITADKELYFYSHCAGSAVAMNIINILEQEKDIKIKHYAAGGNIPPEKAEEESFWKSVSDELLVASLMQAGAPLASFTEKQIADTVTHFREDTDYMTQCFFKQNRKIECPTNVIINKLDIFTSNFEQALENWSKYAENVIDVRYITTKTHYFQADNSRELVEILLDIF